MKDLGGGPIEVADDDQDDGRALRDTIRTLAMDAVQQANSGHPGTPMALAPVVYCLWQRLLRFDPGQPAVVRIQIAAPAKTAATVSASWPASMTGLLVCDGSRGPDVRYRAISCPHLRPQGLCGCIGNHGVNR
jgi:hypothetical protein